MQYNILGKIQIYYWKGVLSIVIQRKLETEKQLTVFNVEPLSKYIRNKTKLVKVILNRMNRGKKTMKCTVK